MLVLGLLTIVAAAGVVTIQRGNSSEEQNPYNQLQQPGSLIAEGEDPVMPTQVAGNSNAEKDMPETSAVVFEEQDQPIAQVGAGNDTAVPLVLNFAETSKMTWPIQGNILLDYSMDSTIYFPTLEQYQCNPGLVIQGEVSEPVLAPANAKVVSVGNNEEIGNFVVLDLGNDYLATCGQLKEVQVMENEYLEQGQLLGYVAEPTKYYSVEGSNVFFELQHQEASVDPLDYFQ